MTSIRDAINIAITADGSRAAAEFKKIGGTAQTELGKAEEGSRNMSASFAKAGAVMGGAAIVAGAALYRAGQAASDLNESVNKSSVIFSEAAGEANKFAEEAVKIGISKQAALEAAGGFGVLFTGIGKSAGEAEKMSEKMVALAADVGSFNNVPVEEALLAIQSGLRGEAEPLREFGVLLDDATLKAYAMKTGLIETTTGALTPAQKAQAAYGVILEQTGKQQGDFARTSDGLANTQKKVSAQFENLTAKIGSAALPVLQQFADVALAVVGVFESLPAPVQAVIGPIAVVGVGLLGVSAAASFAAASFTTMKAQAVQLGVGLKAVGASAATAGRGILAVSGPIGILVGIVAGAAYVFGAFEGDVEDVAAATKGLGKEAANTGKSLNTLTDQAIGQAIVDSEGLAGAMRDAGLSINEVSNYVKGSGPAYDSAVQKVKAYYDAHSNGGIFNDEESDSLKLLTKFLGEQEDQYALNTEEMKRQRTETERLKSSGDDLKDSVQHQNREARRYQRTLYDLVEETNNVHDAQRDAITGGLDYEDSLADQREKTKALTEAIAEYGPNSEEAAQAQRDLTRATLEVSSTFEGGQTAILENAKALAGGKTSGNEFRKALEGVRDTMAPGSPLRVWLDDYITKLNGIPASISTEINANITITTSGGIKIAVGPDGTRVGHTAGKGKAGGGPVYAGMPYTVGEVGPEPFFPAVNGRIISHSDAMSAIRNGAKGGTAVFNGSATASSSGGGGNVYHITLTTLDARTAGTVVVDALKQYERSHGKGWRN